MGGGPLPDRKLRFRTGKYPGSERSLGADAGREFLIRVVCGGKTSPQALDDLSQGLAQAVERGQDALVVLEDLGLLEDSIVAFMRGLSQVVQGYPRTVTFWESSGYTEAFLSVIEGQSPPETPDPDGTSPENPS